jgi:ABC-type nitrate/sulfonate/bicarbonate transport system substrate-binding protein
MRPVTFFLDWELNCQFAGPIWAREKGLYRQAGLEVRLLPPSAQPRKDLIDLVLENDCAAGSIEENLIVRAALASKPVRVVAAMLKQTPLALITARSGPIETLADLTGRRVAMHNDAAHLLVGLLKMNGIDPKSVDLSVADWSLEDLIEGRFDAVQGYAITEARTLAEKGFRAHLIPLCHPDLNPHSQVIFVSVQSIAHRQEDLRGFLQATFEGWRQALARTDEAAAIVAAHSKEHSDATENRAILESVGRYVRGHENGEPLGRLDPARWRRNLASYARCGITEQVADINLVIEPHLFSNSSEQ